MGLLSGRRPDNLGVVKGTLYQREQDGRIVYSTRKLPGSTPVFQFTVRTPPV